jgi:drug/metabolite transporter (DMT)-like permease
VPIVLGLLASLLIGGSDFYGARESGRTTPLQTATAAFLGGVVVALLISPALGTPNARDLLLGVYSGGAAFVALTTLWRGYVKSSLGVVAPVTAVVATALPVLYDAIEGRSPGAIGWIGVVIGVGALFLTSWSPEGRNMGAGVMYGVAAGVAFGVMFIIVVSTSEDAGTWPVVTQRMTAFVLASAAGLVLKQRPMATGSPMRTGLIAGAIGALGVASITYGGQRYAVAPVVVSGSLYAAVAIALGWIFLGEKLLNRQIVGVVGAMLGVALLALD